ncbi:MAG: substrate-binding domain-containing protein [Kiritimatiellae bacterium]|nr:substrate-binding domain-containing protein [Kiritimatiellia bacterium]
MPNRKDLAVVRTDPDSIGEISAHYFLSQGSCRSYGYVPDVLDRQWSQNRGKAFDKALRVHGATCHIFKPSHPRQNDFSELVEWLESLPHPTGILAAYDDRALSVIEACATANLSIPRDISLLSVDDDTFLCENCTPTLSSIRPDQERSGYAAGALMSSLLKDGCERPHVTTLPVKSISHRNSTLMASQSGRLVQKALAYVRRNFKRKISPDSIAAYLGVSRPLLDLRFRELLGTSASKTIDEERLKAVCDRLKTSNATLKEIAKDCGYADCFQLMHKFKQKFGITAASYRRSSHTSTPASIRETSL